ncbi:MAG: efflux RND transporter periplasmic adaptor subunit [Bacteroidaceae bacterium]|nr:efflux RND transporter periplasmic adaptor subunit [Bacteroidaceae bacterium]
MKKIVFAVVLLAVTACHKEKKVSESVMSLPIEVATPVERDVRLTREYPGYLDADATISIVGRVNGTIVKRNFVEGGRVKKGDLLFVIEPTLYENSVAQAQAALQTAKAELDYAKSNYERMKVAINSNAVSQIELLQAKSRVESGEAAVDNARAALNSAKTKLGYCYVKAPENGVVGLRNYSVGAYISGEMNPAELCKLYKDDVMYAYFDISDAQWLKKVERGENSIDQSSITFTMGDGRLFTWDAKIDYLAPDVNLSTGTLRVRAELDNENGFLKPGSYINVVLPYDDIKNALLINDASIGTDQLGKFIYVVTPSNRVEYRRIEAGEIVDDTLRLVTDGLAPGEMYVTKALLKVRNGMSVTPIMEDNRKKM